MKFAHTPSIPPSGAQRTSRAGRRTRQFGVTAHPTAEWTAQLTPRRISVGYRNHVICCGIAIGSSATNSRSRSRIWVSRKSFRPCDLLGSERTSERLIGTLRRECLDHVIVFNEASLYRHVKSSLAYYHESRTHRSLAKDTPEPRPVHPAELAAVVAIPRVGGLHHRYERRAA